MITVYETLEEARAHTKPNLILHPIDIRQVASAQHGGDYDLHVSCLLGYSRGETPETSGRLTQDVSLATLYEGALGAPLVPIDLLPYGEDPVDFGVAEGYDFDSFDKKCQFALLNAQVMLSFACAQIVHFYAGSVSIRHIHGDSIPAMQLVAAALTGGILHINDNTYHVQLYLYATAEVYENLFLTSGVMPFKHDNKGDPFIATICGSSHAPCLLSREQGKARFTLDTEDISWWEFDGSNDDDYAGSFDSLADFEKLLNMYTIIHGRHYVESNTSGTHGMYRLDISNLSIYPGITESIYKNHPNVHPNVDDTDDVMYEAVYGNSMQKFGPSKTIHPHVFGRSTTAKTEAIIEYSPGTAVTRVRRAIASVIMIEAIWLKDGIAIRNASDYLMRLGEAVVKKFITTDVQTDDAALVPYLRLAIDRVISVNAPPLNTAMTDSRDDLRDGCPFTCSISRPAAAPNYVSPVFLGSQTTRFVTFGGDVLTAPAAGSSHGKSSMWANREYFVKTDTTEGIRYSFDDTIDEVASWPSVLEAYADVMEDCEHVNGAILTGDGYWYCYKEDGNPYNHQAIALAHNSSMVPVPAAISLVCIKHASFDITDWLGGDITVRDVSGWELAIPVWNIFALANIGGARETNTYAYGHAAVLQVG